MAVALQLRGYEEKATRRRWVVFRLIVFGVRPESGRLASPGGLQFVCVKLPFMRIGGFEFESGRLASPGGLQFVCVKLPYVRKGGLGIWALVSGFA